MPLPCHIPQYTVSNTSAVTDEQGRLHGNGYYHGQKYGGQGQKLKTGGLGASFSGGGNSHLMPLMRFFALCGTDRNCVSLGMLELAAVDLGNAGGGYGSSAASNSGLEFDSFVQIVVTFCVLNLEDIIRFCYFVMAGGGSKSSTALDPTAKIVNGKELSRFVMACHGGPQALSKCTRTAVQKVEEKCVAFSLLEKMHRADPAMLYPVFQLQVKSCKFVQSHATSDKIHHTPELSLISVVRLCRHSYEKPL